MLKERLKGIILNRVMPETHQEIKTHVIPSLSQTGIAITAAVAEDPVLLFRSLRSVREVLDGHILWGETSLDRPVAQLTVDATALKGPPCRLEKSTKKSYYWHPLHANRRRTRPWTTGPSPVCF
jgi:hypothetical protein